ncbi:MAG: hypothetical protein LUE96_02985 [Lachnospiraceae bacterium]|nr:hypothetical protein [Lachnospiraceae bacterium]
MAEQETKRKRKAKYKAVGDVYESMMKQLDKASLHEDRMSARFQFLNEYSEVIQEYIEDEELKDKPIDPDFDYLVKLYKRHYLKDGFTREENAARMERRGGMWGESADAVRSGLQKANLMPEGDTVRESEKGRPLTGDQMAGLKSISRWMLRNMDKTGVWEMGDSKSAFVRNYVLKQSPRVKLCAYYLVETDARKLKGSKLKQAVAESQSPSYVPNLQKFKDKMIASKFKFWKRLSGSEFYWDKLADSMRFAVAESATILKFGGGGAPEVTENDAGENASAATAGTATQGSGGNSEKEKKKKAADNYRAFLMVHKLILKLMDRRDKAKAGEWKESDEEMLNSATVEYLKYGKQIVKDIQNGEAGDFSADDGTGSEIASALEMEETVEGIVAKGLTNETFLGFIKNAKAAEGTELSGNWLGAASGIASFTAIITEIIRSGKKNSYTSSADKGERAMEILSSIGEMASSALDSYKDLKGIEETTNFAVKSASIASMATGTLNVGAGLASFIGGGVQKYHMTKATEQIKNNGNLTEEEKQKEEQAAALQRRLANAKQVTGSIKMVSGGIQIASGALLLTGIIGVPLSVVLSGIATGVDLMASVYSFFHKRSNLKDTIDDYIHMDDLYPLVKRELDKQLAMKKDANSDPPNESDLKDSIRREAAAQMGYAGLDGFYNYITREYATLIYTKAMLQDDGETPVDVVNGEPRLSQTNRDFAEMLKGYGLKPDYKRGKPTIDTIQKRMANA